MNKIILSIFLTISTYVASAQCENYIDFVQDPISGAGNWTNESNVIFTQDNKDGMVNLLMLSSNGLSIIWLLESTRFSCVKDESRIEVLFTDETRISFNSNTKFNCKGKLTTYFGEVFGKKSYMKDFSNKLIKMIRVTNDDSMHTETVSNSDAEHFRNVFSCLEQKIR